MLLRSLAVLVVVLASSFCMAQGTSDLIIGYSNMQLGEEGEGFEDAGGLGIATRLSAQLSPLDIPEVRINLGLGASFYDADVDEETNANIDDDADLMLFRFEFGPSWKAAWGNFFVEPSAMGVAMLGRLDGAGGGAQFKGGWGFQPGLRIGWIHEKIQFGFDAHYLIGRLQFSNSVGGDLDEYFLGGFLGVRW